MENVILVIHVLAAAAVIGLVLLQHGKGADMGAAFGSGASGSLFGVSGSSNLLSKLTSIFITVFFATSLTLAFMSSHRVSTGSVVKSAVTQEAPATAVSTESAKPVENTPKDIPN
ncbi:preprotein translocase subunit SecG [Methylophilus aquaticus]|uniref:Protein-export membrane protein SecG n=1 Tax=Methylophilus aquaticus TaxID=1971610 RepID=A0ABT9JU55_9PROT|nr:preprotein translocase subunit SecG [Methylophilus aquaticus]MDP8567640.1 preprotein translocase subunit SecG [Methylophilus aquaticus]